LGVTGTWREEGDASAEDHGVVLQHEPVDLGERRRSPETLERLAAEPASRALFAEYLRSIVRRLTAERDVTLTLFELRLESTRRPKVDAVLGAWQRAGFETDVAFNTAAGLPGDRRNVALFHYAVDGLLFDRGVREMLSEDGYHH
jgi:hypothetical protein